VKEIARQTGAVLVFDEVTAAWRFNTGGAHLLYGVLPDIAVFAKAISSGFPMAAIIGTGTVMQAAQDTFISSTYRTERIGPAAALATIRKHKKCDVPAHLDRIGNKVQAAWKNAAQKAVIPLTVGGFPPLSHFSFEVDYAQAVRTLFTQLMLEQGFLATNAFYANYAHSEEDADRFGANV
jgi:glutamate-1-semialdehyde 2,1-aminomutase